MAQKQPPVFRGEDEVRLIPFLRSAEVEAARQAYLINLRDARAPDCSVDPTYTFQPTRGPEYSFDDTYTTLDFPAGAERPVAAVWYETYEVSICNVREDARARISVLEGNPANASWAPPGTTRLTEADIRRYWPGIARASTNHVRGVGGCPTHQLTPEGTLITTRLDGGPGWFGTARENAWDEEWTMRLCGRNAPFEMRIERDPETGNLTLSQRVLMRTYNGRVTGAVGVRSTSPEAVERRRQRQEDNDDDDLH